MNNPFNIRKTPADWVGKVHGIEHAFETFEDSGSGLRAGFRILLTYFGKDVNTVSAIISRFAPPPENNTGGYIDFVSRRLAVDPTDVLEPTDRLLLNLAKAIITFEQGKQPFTDVQLMEALNDARN